jgi:phospholipid/cholesterol/gamma-HCH transport system ATP-binding protein
MSEQKLHENAQGVSFFNRLTHSFSQMTVESSISRESYESSRGVGIKIDNLCKSFNGQPVLQNINLEIQPGEIFSIIGASGTGKSVLLRHLAKLLKPDSGEILIDNENINFEPGLLIEQTYRYSMVFQTSALFNSLTVGENVGLWLREKDVLPERRIRRVIREKLRLVGLEGRESMQISDLSGGMKKRVAIARSLAMNPDLIFYDEPTAELDPVTTDELARVIENLKDKVNLTTIIVSHDLNFALYLSDRVAMMYEGEIIEIGTPEEIKNSRNPLVRRFLYTRTKGIQGNE